MSTAAVKPVTVTEAMYYRGRDQTHANELTPELRANALSLLGRVNTLLGKMAACGVQVESAPHGWAGPVTSGWRPANVNKTIPGAAVRSNHMRCLAIDLFDPEGALDDWCMDNLDVLMNLGLHLEHPSATKGWCHLQAVPPRSGKRVFYP